MVHIRRAQASSLPSLGMTSQFHIQPRGNIFHFIRRHPTPLPQPIVSLNRRARSLSNGLRITAGSLKHNIEGVTLFCGMEQRREERARKAAFRSDLCFFLSILFLFIDIFYFTSLVFPFFFHILFSLMTYFGCYTLKYWIYCMLLKYGIKIFYIFAQKVQKCWKEGKEQKETRQRKQTKMYFGRGYSVVLLLY